MQVLWNEESITLETSDSTATYTRSEDNTMVVDFYANTIEFVDYDLFIQNQNANTLLDMLTLYSFNKADEPALFQRNKSFSFDRYGDIKTLHLGDYSIELVHQDGFYLMPLQTMFDFLMAPKTNLNAFYNGQCLMIAQAVNPESEVYYAAPTGDRSEALAKYGYGELCLMLDSMYGLKDVHDIHSFAQLFYEIGFDEPLSGASAEDADLSIYALINSYLDDIHSEWGAYSYLTGQSDTRFHVGPSETRWERHVDDYQYARAEAYPDGWLAYEEVGNTAYVTFDSFKAEAKSSEEYYDPELVAENPVWDTITLILYAHQQINREGSPIENVVIDLSNNTGGAVDAAVVVIAWYLGEASLSIKDTFTGAMSNSIYRADVNLDRVFDDTDTVADKNLYCLISPVSFSCGNLVPCAFKESGKVTLLGRTSVGGSCMVLSASSAWGTSFKLSSPYRTSFLKNGTFYDIDRGADPDYPISAPAKFFDRVTLTDYINSLY